MVGYNCVYHEALQVINIVSYVQSVVLLMNLNRTNLVSFLYHLEDLSFVNEGNTRIQDEG